MSKLFKIFIKSIKSSAFFENENNVNKNADHMTKKCRQLFAGYSKAKYEAPYKLSSKTNSIFKLK